MNTALLILRLVLGLAMAAHGSQKLFGWFGGPGLTGFGSFLESIGFRPGIRFALVAGFIELSSGLLVALGLAGPIGPALMVSVMIVAAITVHLGHGFFVSTNGIELPVLYLTGAIALAFTGAGQYSLDYVFGLNSLFSQIAIVAALSIGVLGAIGNLALRATSESAIKSL
jgi:putative oxidoreductase